MKSKANIQLRKLFYSIASLLTLGAGTVFSGTAARAEETVAWESEIVSDRASAALKSILGSLEGKGISDATMGELVKPECQAGVLRPETMAEEHAEAALRVRRAGKTDLAAPTASTGIAGVKSQVAALAKPFSDPAKCHFKIKIIEPDLRAAPVLKTKLLFFLTGETAAGRLEHQALWEAHWHISGDLTHPKLALTALKCLRCEEAASSGTAPWLADCTEAMLGRIPWFREQFCYGNPWWRTRLQKSFDQFVYGHRGLSIGDANGDGLDDVYLCEEGGLPNRLLLQQPDGSVLDFSTQSGTDLMEVTRSALFLDLDEDADQDLVLTIPQGLLMLENMGGAKFRQRTLLPQAGDAYGLAAADFDDNGFVDIYVCSYQPRSADMARLPFPAPFYDARNGGENFLVSNTGNWKFANATVATGLNAANDRYSFAAMWTDYDNDGLLDLAVVNDFGKNNLFRQSRTGGKVTFTDVTDQIGLQDGAFGMAITGGDANRDGWMDLYTANMFSSAGHRIVGQPKFKPSAGPDLMQKFRHLARGNSLFLNGQGKFQDISDTAGVAMGRWSWGSHFADLNNDGWEDLLVGNGNITGHSDEPDL